MNYKKIYFVGIGGIGMSGIAEVMHNLGFTILGSDLSINQNTSRLKKLGIEIFEGHERGRISMCDAVVVSTAIPHNNPEVTEAREIGIPILRRSEMLSKLMTLKKTVAISGSHGKTTTTSMVASLLDEANLCPTVVNGGILNSYGTNARLGMSEWAVIEADESDGSFLDYNPNMTIITNIDFEHAEKYKNIEEIQDYFQRFVDKVPSNGCVTYCSDDFFAKELIQSNKDVCWIPYGISEEASAKGCNIELEMGHSIFDICVKHDRLGNYYIRDVFIPLTGLHNVLNALGAISIALNIGIDEEVIKNGLRFFKGVKRRFTKIGDVNGIRIIDDYAHHPTEIINTIKSAKIAGAKRVISVIQPHRYSRLNALFDKFAHCFEGSYAVIVAPVYSAGEDPIYPVSSANLVRAIRKIGNVPLVVDIDSAQELPFVLRNIVKKGDFVLCMGAGSITYWASLLPSQLSQLSSSEKDSQSRIASYAM